jgi:hypothetical protein
MEKVRGNLSQGTIVAAVVLAIIWLGLLLSFLLWPERSLPSYLFAFAFWGGLTLGCFPVAMLYYLVGGKWGDPIRDYVEAGIGTFPLLLVLVLPILIGASKLYPWAGPLIGPTKDLIERKSMYLNIPFFVLRLILWALVWGVLGTLLLRYSYRQRTGDQLAATRSLRRVSGPGIVIFGFATSFAVLDLFMTVEPTWYSSVYPAIILFSQILASISLGVVLSGFREPERIERNATNQLGDLLLAFVMFWAYLSLAQILIIYAGNLPHEISFYLLRMRGGWLIIAWLIVIFQFGLPFTLLLFRTIKRDIIALRSIALCLLILQAVCAFWYVIPPFRPQLRLDWFDPLTFFGLGFTWIVFFILHFRRLPVPQSLQPHPVETS